MTGRVPSGVTHLVASGGGTSACAERQPLTTEKLSAVADVWPEPTIPGEPPWGSQGEIQENE